MEKIYLSVVIPAYNEEKRIGKTLLDIDRYLSKQQYTYEIIVVNDGAKDKTAQVVNKFANLIKNLRLIDNKKNNGSCRLMLVQSANRADKRPPSLLPDRQRSGNGDINNVKYHCQANESFLLLHKQ